MKETSKSALIAFALILCAGISNPSRGQSPQEEPGPGALGIEEVFELNEAPQIEPPPGTQPPEVEPDGDGYSTDKEREEAAAAALTDPRAETPDQILGSDPEPPPPPQTEGLIGDSAIVRSFAGIDFPTSGSQIPDTSLARSPNRVLEATNGMLRLTGTDGTLKSQMSMDAFFGLSGQAAGTIDPKAFYDNLGPTKVFVIAVMGKGTPKALHLAVSRKPDPDTLTAPANWCRFMLTHPSIVPQTLADYPGLGAGPEHLILTSNHFGPTNSGTLVRLIAKNVLYNITDTTKPCPLTVASISVLPLLSDSTGANLRTLQPVQFSTSPGSAGGVTTLGYLVSTVKYGSSEYRVWSLQRNSAGALVRPLPSRVVQASKLYLEPPPANQPPTFPGATNTVSTGDGRILQAVGSGNTIWFTQTTGCHVIGTSVNDSCANVMQLNVTPGAGDPLVTFGQQSLLGAGAGVSMWQPAIAMTTTGHVAIVYHQGSTNLPLSLAVAVKRSTTTLFRALPLDQGACSQSGIALRSGDYLGAHVDPSGTSFWVAGEKLFDFDPNPDPQRVNCKWATFVKEVRP
jgi:hypothetical protein